MFSAPHPQLSPMVAYVAYARPERLLAKHGEPQLRAVLSADEQARYERFHVPEAAAVYLTAHALTRYVLGRALNCSPQSLCFVSSERGRPELAGLAAESGIRFNLSHTSGLVACGIALRAAIGVDVEHLARRVDMALVAPRVFSPRERAGLAALEGEAQRRRFFDLWTLKEAYVKGTGKGLAGPLHAVSFDAAADDPVPVHFEPEAQDHSEAWYFRRLTVPDAHCLAVALDSGSTTTIQFEELTCLIGR
ncbi:MAG: hypothetical protein RL701_7342 [Pseudomonadota bacterium]